MILGDRKTVRIPHYSVARQLEWLGLPCLRTGCPCFTPEDLELVDPPFERCLIDFKVPNFEIYLTEARNFDFELGRTQFRPLDIRGDVCDFSFRDDDGNRRFRTLFLNSDEQLETCRDYILDWMDDTDGCPE